LVVLVEVEQAVAHAHSVGTESEKAARQVPTDTGHLQTRVEAFEHLFETLRLLLSILVFILSHECESLLRRFSNQKQCQKTETNKNRATD